MLSDRMDTPISYCTRRFAMPATDCHSALLTQEFQVKQITDLHLPIIATLLAGWIAAFAGCERNPSPNANRSLRPTVFSDFPKISTPSTEGPVRTIEDGDDGPEFASLPRVDRARAWAINFEVLDSAANAFPHHGLKPHSQTMVFVDADADPYMDYRQVWGFDKAGNLLAYEDFEVEDGITAQALGDNFASEVLGGRVKSKGFSEGYIPFAVPVRSISVWFVFADGHSASVKRVLGEEAHNERLSQLMQQRDAMMTLQRP